jgi:copper chaperone CopZ
MRKETIFNISLVMVAVALLAFFGLAVKAKAQADAVTVLRTAGMTCGSCAGAIEKALRKEPGIASVEVDVNNGWVVVGYDTKQARPEQIAATVTGSGYGSSVWRVLSVAEYRQLTGKNPAQAGGGGGGCGCCAPKPGTAQTTEKLQQTNQQQKL